MIDFIMGFTSGLFMFLAIFFFFIKLLVKTIKKKDEIVYRLYHEGQLPIISRIEGLAILVQMGIEKKDQEGVSKLLHEIKLLKYHLKEVLKKIQ